MKNIMMNTEMTKAILDGRKTQTRRVVKFNDNFALVDAGTRVYYDGEILSLETLPTFSKYQKGDIVWVREPARVINYIVWVKEPMKVINYIESNITMKVEYFDGKIAIINIPKRFLDEDGYIKVSWIKKRQGIPNGCIKEMARIFLRITDVKVERLHSCYSYEDLQAEGLKIEDENGLSKFQEEMQDEWIELWNKTAPKGYKWDDNPYVFVYEFERVNRDGSKYE